MRLGLDVDGILANFYTPYEQLCIEVEGRDLFGSHRYPNQLPPVWNWPEHYGFSKETVREVWRRIANSPTFWTELETLPDMGYLSKLNPKWEVYFITARPGIEPKHQTEKWFWEKTGKHVTVCVSADKAGMATALELHAYVDDKLENALDVDLTRAASYLLDRPYNHTHEFNMGNVQRRNTLGEVLDELSTVRV